MLKQAPINREEKRVSSRNWSALCQELKFPCALGVLEHAHPGGLSVSFRPEVITAWVSLKGSPNISESNFVFCAHPWDIFTALVLICPHSLCHIPLNAPSLCTCFISSLSSGHSYHVLWPSSYFIVSAILWRLLILWTEIPKKESYNCVKYLHCTWLVDHGELKCHRLGIKIIVGKIMFCLPP